MVREPCGSPGFATAGGQRDPGAGRRSPSGWPLADREVSSQWTRGERERITAWIPKPQGTASIYRKLDLEKGYILRHMFAENASCAGVGIVGTLHFCPSARKATPGGEGVHFNGHVAVCQEHGVLLWTMVDHRKLTEQTTMVKLQGLFFFSGFDPKPHHLELWALELVRSLANHSFFGQTEREKS